MLGIRATVLGGIESSGKLYLAISVDNTVDLGRTPPHTVDLIRRSADVYQPEPR